MTKMAAKQRAAWEQSRDLNAELREAIADAKHGHWVRKTEFRPLADGRMRRIVTPRDGTVEKNEIIPAVQANVVTARATSSFFHCDTTTGCTPYCCPISFSVLTPRTASIPTLALNSALRTLRFLTSLTVQSSSDHSLNFCPDIGVHFILPCEGDF